MFIKVVVNDHENGLECARLLFNYGFDESWDDEIKRVQQTAHRW